MSYQQERDQFIARMTTEGLPLEVTLALLKASTTLNRYAEMACSSEAADRDRVECPAATETVRQYGSAARPPMRTIISPWRVTGPCLCDDYPAGSHAAGKHSTVPRFRIREAALEGRIAKRLEGLEGWSMETQGDPRGYVLRVIPPSYQARNQGRDRGNRESIGVPCRESGIKW